MTPTLHVLRLDGFISRLRGLLGRPAPSPGTAVWLVPCHQVHTLGMSYAIDVVHLDARGVILRIATVRPWRMSRHVGAAVSVLELAAGEADRIGLAVGMTPSLIEEETRASRDVSSF
jgi:uncharacterized protein